jgi:hypothetical protein
MMADSTKTRENLLIQFEESWNELNTYLNLLTEKQLTELTDDAGWTVKDHIIHIAMWDKAELALLDRKSRRDVMDVPLDVWNSGDDPINAVVQERYRDMPAAEVLQAFRQVHENIMSKLKSMTDADFQLPFSHYQADSTDERPLMRWMNIATINHYRDHLPWIKAIAEKA